MIINSKRTSTWVVSSLFLAIRFRYSTFVLVYLICTAKVLIFVWYCSLLAPCRRLIFTQLPTYPNKIKELIPSSPNEVWVSDITYQKIWDDAEQGTYHFCYISLITDYYTKEIIGYSVGESLSTRFPLKALNMALMRMESYKDNPLAELI